MLELTDFMVTMICMNATNSPNGKPGDTDEEKEHTGRGEGHEDGRRRECDRSAGECTQCNIDT